MVGNPERRALVCGAALELLGREGPRAVTHRAVDAEARLPAGTTSNYFPSRSALFVGMSGHLFEALAPSESRLETLAGLPTADAGPAYVGYIVERLLERPNLARAWLELRLEAMRAPEIAAVVEPVIRAGFDADVAFVGARGLPGGAGAVRALHHLVDGILLDALTLPLDPHADPVVVAMNAARALLQSGAAGV